MNTHLEAVLAGLRKKHKGDPVFDSVAHALHAYVAKGGELKELPWFDLINLKYDKKQIRRNKCVGLSGLVSLRQGTGSSLRK